MQTQPLDELLLCLATISRCGNDLHQFIGKFDIISFDALPIKPEENITGNNGGALVPIEKGMRESKANHQRCSLGDQIGSFVCTPAPAAA